MVDRQILVSERTPGLTAFTPARPLLLLTDFPPEEKGGGAVILRSLLTQEDRDRIVWVTLSPADARSEHRVVSLAPAVHRSLLKDGTIRTRALRRSARSVMLTYGATAAWVVAHGAAVRIAPSLIATGVPVHITVHDDPAWAYALLTRRYLALGPLLERDLGRSLRGARSVDVVSGAMSQRYRARHAVESTVVHRGLSGPVQPAPEYDRDQGVRVAVLGSTYGVHEIGVLSQALALVGQRIRVPTRLTVIGAVDRARLRRICAPSVAIETTGHLDEAQGTAILRGSFLLYLCYPFAWRGRVLRTTSFPTKLSTYVMAARPVLLHMPSESSVSFLGATSPYATLWNSLVPDEGAEIIGRLWRNRQTVQSFHVAAEDVRRQHFDRSRNRATLFRALNSLPHSDGP